MGYYTSYHADIYDNRGHYNGDLEEKIAHAIARLPYFNCDNEDIMEIDDVIGMEAIKWYDYIDDMKHISLQFPDVTIIISGQGEDSDDIWRTYFKNGQYAHYKAKIVFPEFNPADFSL